MLWKEECLRFDITFELKAIHRRTYRNKIKKPCWQQLPISKYLLP